MLTFVLDFTAAGILFHSLVRGMKWSFGHNCCFDMASVVCTLTYRCCARGELADKVQMHIPKTYF